MSKVLLISNEATTDDMVGEALEQIGADVVTLRTAEAGAKRIVELDPDVLLLALEKTNGQVVGLLGELQKECPQMPVIVISSPVDSETTIEIMQAGAFEHLIEPLDSGEMEEVLREAVQCGENSRRAVQLGQTEYSADDFALIGTSRAMQDVYKAIGRVAATDATVLLTGETGTGKELVAHAIYNHSTRQNHRFVTLNCAAIPQNLLESKLFGHEKGAFTGAVGRRIGKFEQANKGTILLDEIGEMPLELQSKLLRVLQQGRIERVGGSETIAVDVRVIAATNRDLAAETVAGTFREDLFHRLNAMDIRLPPLRERREDIPQLVDYFYVQLTESKHLKSSPITPEAMEEVTAYDWPGNVRELRHCVSQALIMSGGYPVTGADIREILLSSPSTRAGEKPELLDPSALARAFLDEAAEDDNDVLRHFLGQMECAMLRVALKQTNGNQSQAAKMLGISRPSVRAKLDKYEIDLDEL